MWAQPEVQGTDEALLTCHQDGLYWCSFGLRNRISEPERIKRREQGQELGRAGWRRGRRFGEGTPEGDGGKFAGGSLQWQHPDGGLGGDEFQLVLLDGGGLLLLGLLTFIDEFAELAGVFAVEGFLDGLAEGGVLGVGHGHVHPRDDLQDRPVCAERKRERQGYQDFATTGKHDGENLEIFDFSSIEFCMLCLANSCCSLVRLSSAKITAMLRCWFLEVQDTPCYESYNSRLQG